MQFSYSSWMIQVGDRYLVSKGSYGIHKLVKKSEVAEHGGVLLFKSQVAAKRSLRSICECTVQYGPKGKRLLRKCKSCRIGQVIPVQISLTTKGNI